MNKDALISVIVPVYNVEMYLDECIQSVLSQTYKNIEIILVDDGSTDKCPYICDYYSRQDSRVKVIHKKNGGLSDARNIGTKESKGEFITFVDSDDILDNYFVEVCYEKIYEYDAEMVIMPNLKFYKTISFPNKNEVKFELHDGKYCIKKMLSMDVNYHTGAHGKLYKRLLCLENSYPFGKYYEDLATTYKMWEKCEKVVCINQAFYGYRVRKDSIMTERFTRKKMDCVDVSDELFQNIIDKYPNLKTLVAGRCLSICSNVFLQIPLNQFEDEQDILWQRICFYRKYLLLGINARKKAVFAAWASFLGRNAYRQLFTKYRQKSKQYQLEG